jgi:hypothetical protein
VVSIAYIPDIEAEYGMATGEADSFQPIVVYCVPIEGSTKCRLALDLLPPVGNAGTTMQPGRVLPLATGFSPPGACPSDTIYGPTIVAPNISPRDYMQHLRTYLLYTPTVVNLRRVCYITPKSRSRLLLPEEVPLFLMFFHLGSVIRYKPAFYERVAESAFLPMLLAAERHCTLKFLLLFHNGMHQRSHFLASADSGWAG